MPMNTTHAAAPDTPTLAEYVAVVWRRMPVIVGVAVVLGAIATYVSLSSPRWYESTVTFAATQSKLGDGGVSNTAQFRIMVENLSTAASVISETGLDKAPYNMKPSEFLDAITVAEVRGTNLITVRIALPDASLAATVANHVADHTIQTARRVSAGEASYARDLVKEQLDQARQRLDEVQRELKEFRQKSRLEIVRKEIEVRLGLGGPAVFMDDPSRARGLLDAVLKMASERAKLASAERELAARRPSPADTVSQGLEAAAAAARSSLAALEQQQLELRRTHQLDSDTLALLDHLYILETEMTRRDVERTVAEKIYSELAQKYQDARLQVIGKSAELVVIDPAVASDRPLPRNAARNIVVVVVAWLCFAVAGVLALSSVQRRRATL